MYIAFVLWPCNVMNVRHCIIFGVPFRVVPRYEVHVSPVVVVPCLSVLIKVAFVEYQGVWWCRHVAWHELHCAVIAWWDVKSCSIQSIAPNDIVFICRLIQLIMFHCHISANRPCKDLYVQLLACAVTKNPWFAVFVAVLHSVVLQNITTKYNLFVCWMTSKF